MTGDDDSKDAKGRTRRSALRLLGATVAGAAAIGAGTGTAAAATFSDDQRVATTADLIVREWPGLDYDVVDVADAGAAGYVRDGPFERDGYVWWDVAFNAGYRAWAVEAYLAAAPLDGGGDAAFDIGQQVATTVDLSVREGPSTGESRLDVAPAGTTGWVKDGYVTSDGYTWWRVAYETGVTGWSVETYLTGDTGSVGADFGWPVSGPITADWYDERSYGYHRSIDVAATTGTPIGAARAGTVANVLTLDAGGRSVFVDHENGYQTRYMHMSDWAVGEGESVDRGDTVGYVGSTGHSTGPHLHFELERYGENQYVPGEEGTAVAKGDGIQRDYDGL